jgi:hypothetical protein
VYRAHDTKLNPLVLVQPDTVVRWHRDWLRRRWARRSGRIRSGRPNTDAAIRTPVSQMAAVNPLWGTPRIHGELGKLGIAVSQATIAKYMLRRRQPPSQAWRTFLANPIGQVMAADFFVVPTATCVYLPSTASEAATISSSLRA